MAVMVASSARMAASLAHMAAYLVHMAAVAPAYSSASGPRLKAKAPAKLTTKKART